MGEKMNYDIFQTYRKAFRLEEIKVIGRDVSLDGTYIHIVGMGCRQKCDNEGTFLYVLEEQSLQGEHIVCRANQTKRQFMLESAAVNRNNGKALHISEIEIGGEHFELQGGSMGNLSQAEFAEAYFFFQQMIENGWSIPEESPFYRLDWNCIGLAELRLSESGEKLPELTGAVSQLTLWPTSRDYIVQVPVRLERGKTAELRFVLEEDGEEIVCYINQVKLLEPLKEEQKKFNDAQYQERILQHVSAEEFETMKKTALDSIKAQCPAGMGYFTVEYECTKDNFSAQFYAAEELDCIREPAKTTVIGGSSGPTSVILMGGKSNPDQETGPHGMRSRCAMIQHAVPVGTEILEAELFMMIEMIPGRTYRF